MIVLIILYLYFVCVQDRLLAELLKEHEQWIVTYHEHDSLLENKEEEELNEEERKAAWEDYENEKKGKVFPSMLLSNNLVFYYTVYVFLRWLNLFLCCTV